jgi:hypothetical protein
MNAIISEAFPVCFDNYIKNAPQGQDGKNGQKRAGENKNPMLSHGGVNIILGKFDHSAT